MEGRWVVEGHDPNRSLRCYGPRVPDGPIDVVPCNDAAIERAVDAVFEVEAYYSKRRLRELFEIAFRAAGETP